MGRMPFFSVVAFISLVVYGCGTGPHPRMESYLGPPGKQVGPGLTKDLTTTRQPLRTGLLVVNDTADPDSAPPLSADTISALTDIIRGEVEKNFPMRVETIIPGESFSPTGQLQQLVQVGQDHQVAYVVLAILSSSEVEVPERFPLGGSLQGGGGLGWLLGYRAENYALVEMALVDVQTGRPLVQAKGKAWAVLDRLDVPIESNVYPVVRRAQLIAPIFPEKDEDAHDVLRGVAANDAIREAFMHFKNAWVGDLPS